MRARIFDAIVKIDQDKKNSKQQIGLVRLTQLALHRFGNPGGEVNAKLIEKLDPLFPAKTFGENWLLCETLSYLQAPNTAKKGMALIAQAGSQEPQMEYARSLRMLKAGWTPELREQQLNWFLKAANYRGGASFTKFIEFIRNDSLATFTEAEKKTHAALIARKPERKSAIESAGAIFAGRTPTMWTLDQLSEAAGTGMKNRNFKNGRKMFSAAACYTCHRFGNAGGMNGPDLTGAGGRYNPHDLLDSIINPSKEINEQFAPIVVTKTDGSIVTGVVVNLSGDNVTLNTDLTDPNQRVNGLGQVVENMGIDLTRFTDQAQVKDLLDGRFRIPRRPSQLFGADQVAVLARQADGDASGLVDGRDDLLVDGARKHHLDDVHGLPVGDPEAIDKPALDLQSLQHGADLRAAAVHDHRVHSHLAQQHHVAGEHPCQFIVAHGVAAVLNDEGVS